MITIERLMDDGRSQKVKDGLYIWEAAKNSRNLLLLWGCPDSRQVLPNSQYIHVFSITAGGPRSPFQELLTDSRIKANVVVCHHDGDEAIPGQSPGGCGGRKAKVGSNENDSNEDGIKGFVSAHIWESDLVKQSYVAGAFTSYRSGKLTLATTQDHLTLAIYPLVVFRDGGRIAESEVPQHFLLAEKYFPNQIYKDGIPVLRKERVPNIFNDFFEENINQSAEIAARLENLAAMQKEQNPRLLVISKEARPFSLRHPYDPGEIFRVSMAGLQIDEDIPLTMPQLVNCLQQIHYPIEHFSNLDTLLIETSRLEQSAKDARVLMEQRWMRDWLSDPNHRILVGEVKKGITERIVNTKDI